MFHGQYLKDYKKISINRVRINQWHNFYKWLFPNYFFRINHIFNDYFMVKNYSFYFKSRVFCL